MTTLYADLSHHDWGRAKGELDWAAIRKATSPVLCLRVTYGDPNGFNPASPHAAEMARGAKAAGFDTIGGYHNLIKGDQASTNRQVDYLRRALDGAGAVWAMLDVERYPELVANGLWPRWDDVRRFVDRWHAVDKRVLAVYLPQWIWSGHLGKPDLRGLRGPLVASNYGTNPASSPSGVYSARGGDSGPGWAAYGGVTPSIWQYGSNINCPGASKQTDVNAFRGSLAQLRALLTGPVAGPPAGPLTGPPQKENDMPTAKEIAQAVWRYDPDDAKDPSALVNPPWRSDAKTNPTVKYSFGLGDIWNRVHDLQEGQAASRLRDEAILRAVTGGAGADQLLAEIRAVGARVDDLAELVRAAQRGELAADEVVRLIGERLTALTTRQQT
ncbi:hypothetical protein ABZ671_00915 [Micromonospora sp. NPDC006766]|uniref:hypothetical protein n=1 Tax=Micromonospora sp. NPDC006766 TaxID=3154778 RepID=UPI0033F5000E